MPAISRFKKKSAASSAAAVATKRNRQTSRGHNADQHRDHETAMSSLSNFTNGRINHRRTGACAITQHGSDHVFSISVGAR